MLLAFTGFVLLFIHAPLALVVLNSFNTSLTFEFPPPAFTTRWWGVAFDNQGVRDALVTSLTVAPEFLESGKPYKVEVLAIEVGGNQTITEVSFVTQ